MTSALLVLLFLGAPASDRREITVRVLTETERDGFADPDLEKRRDSIKDLTAKLAKKKGVRVVPNTQEADVTVEILGREMRETGNEWRFGAETTKETAAALRARLVVGDYTNELVARSDGRLIGEWGEVAGKMANQIAKWIEQNRAHLEERAGKRR